MTFSKECMLVRLIARKNKLSSDEAVNYKLIKKLKRKIRNLEGNL